MIAGRLHGFLEVGTRFGWWSRKSAAYVSDVPSHRMAKTRWLDFARSSVKA